MLSSDKFLSLVLHFSQILVLTLECIHVCSWTLTLKMHQHQCVDSFWLGKVL